MEFTETLRLAAPLEEVWNFFSDPQAVATCIPGCEAIEPTEQEGVYRGRLVTQLGPFKVGFDVEIEQLEATPQERVVAAVRGKDGRLGSSLSQRLEVRLEPNGDGHTNVQMTTSVRVMGKLAALGHGLIQRKAEAIMRDFETAVRERLEGGRAHDPTIPS